MDPVRKLRLDELGRMATDDFQASTKAEVVLVLDDVRSLHNVGSIFRTADAFRIEKLILCGITGTPPHREILKTALGATESVQWEYVPNVADALQMLKNSGYRIAALEQTTGSIPLGQKPLNDAKYAFVFGNEVNGVSDAALARCDDYFEIPQFGTKHSFNVSISAGILLWEWFRWQSN